MHEVNRKIYVIGINSYVFGDLPTRLQDLFVKTENIAIPNSYYEEIKLWSEKDSEKKKRKVQIHGFYVIKICPTKVPFFVTKSNTHA